MFVEVDPIRIPSFANELKNVDLPVWDNELQFLGNMEETAQYYFFLDSINFCFWAEKGKEKWAFKKGDEWLTGYYAYSYAIKKAVETNKDLLNAKYLSKIPLEEFLGIFHGKNELLLLKERHQIIQENFTILLDKYDGSAANLIKTGNKDVNKLIENITTDFPSFRDIAKQDSQEIYFLKRAQLFVNDMNFSLKNQELGEFRNMEDLSIFADYKIPQILEASGILTYRRGLRAKIAQGELIPAGSREEIEIRANTVYVCELIREELGRVGRKIDSNQLDWILWVLAKNREFELPYHKTVTTFY